MARLASYIPIYSSAKYKTWLNNEEIPQHKVEGRKHFRGTTHIESRISRKSSLISDNGLTRGFLSPSPEV